MAFKSLPVFAQALIKIKFYIFKVLQKTTKQENM
jgi:hypothetical protein